jgi:hypothetical protein
LVLRLLLQRVMFRVLLRQVLGIISKISFQFNIYHL